MRTLFMVSEKLYTASINVGIGLVRADGKIVGRAATRSGRVGNEDARRPALYVPNS